MHITYFKFIQHLQQKCNSEMRFFMHKVVIFSCEIRKRLIRTWVIMTQVVNLLFCLKGKILENFLIFKSLKNFNDQNQFCNFVDKSANKAGRNTFDKQIKYILLLLKFYRHFSIHSCVGLMLGSFQVKCNTASDKS